MRLFLMITLPDPVRKIHGKMTGQVRQGGRDSFTSKIRGESFRGESFRYWRKKTFWGKRVCTHPTLSGEKKYPRVRILNSQSNWVKLRQIRSSEVKCHRKFVPESFIIKPLKLCRYIKIYCHRIVQSHHSSLKPQFKPLKLGWFIDLSTKFYKESGRARHAAIETVELSFFITNWHFVCRKLIHNK